MTDRTHHIIIEGDCTSNMNAKEVKEMLLVTVMGCPLENQKIIVKPKKPGGK